MPGFVQGMRKHLLALALIAGALVAPHPAIIAPGFAQAPPPVPAEPDTERRTRYSGVSGVTTFSVAFDIFGDGTDYQNWVEVWVNGIPVPQAGNWTMVPLAGSFTNLSRPLLGANLNIVFAVAQSGTIDIVGARRPRRTSQLSNNAGVTARDFNQIVTDLWMSLREVWDRNNDLTGRAIMGVPGDTFAPLPPALARAGQYLCFASPSGAPTLCAGAQGSGTIAAGNGITFTGSNPTMIAANLSGGSGIVVSGTNPLLISLDPGVNGNVLSAKTANYPIATTDCNKTISGTGGPWTLTLPAASGFSSVPRCVVQVCNNDPNDASHHAIRLSGFPAPSFPRLWMGQCQEVSLVNGGWSVTKFPGRFTPAFTPTFFIDNAGSDSNDGLVSASPTNAIAHVSRCIYLFQVEFDMSNAGIPTCAPTSGQIFTEAGLSYPPGGTGLGVFNLIGNGGMATLRTTGNVVLEIYDFAGYIIFANIQLDCTGAASHPCWALFIHQQSGVDLSSAAPATGQVQFIGAANSDVAVMTDGQAKINSANAPLLHGTFGTGFSMDQNSVLDLNQGLTVDNGAVIANNLIQLTHASSLLFSGLLTLGSGNSVNQVVYANSSSIANFATFTLSGSIGGGGKQWAVLNNSILCNASAVAIPGSAGQSSGFSPVAAPGIIVNGGVSGFCNP